MPPPARRSGNKADHVARYARRALQALNALPPAPCPAPGLRQGDKYVALRIYTLRGARGGEGDAAVGDGAARRGREARS